MEREMKRVLQDKIEKLRKEKPEHLGIYCSAGSPENVRSAFEEVLARQNRMLDLMDEIVDKLD